jgi:hypothetical protein
MAKNTAIYQLKISLNYVKPPIWRRFLVQSDIKLPDLHKVIQTVMGWTNSHLNQFIIDDVFYCEPSEDYDMDYKDYRRVRLNQVINSEKQKFLYEYDFGDSWEHTLLLEKILPADKSVDYPICIDGKRNCPPEDCGGSGGYEELLKIIKNPRHKEHNDMIEWLGDEFDPEEFDIDFINESLKEKDYGCLTLF